MLIRRVGILYHPMLQATRSKAQELTHFFSSRDIDVWACSAWETEKAIGSLDSTDLIITAGGDGTILRAASVSLVHQIPIIGINMGKLGFLTEFKADEAIDRLPELLAGHGWLDERAMLEAELIPAESTNKAPEIFYALNDVVVARGAIAKLIQIETSVDGTPVTTYRADGLVLATATGSTGYSLASGGPILFPQSEDILLVPIVSHLSLGYSLVLSSSSQVKLRVITSNPATLSIDGYVNFTLFNDSLVAVKRSFKKARFLRLHPKDYFYSALEEKLRGKK